MRYLILLSKQNYSKLKDFSSLYSFKMTDSITPRGVDSKNLCSFHMLVFL